MSNSRRQIEAWLKTIDVKGDVADVGGLFWPVKGRTKTWDVNNYHIWDVHPGRKGVRTNVVCDFNKRLPVYLEYDHVFCLETTDHFWNLGQAFTNMSLLGRMGSLIHISSNFLFPHHTGQDHVRLTIVGLTTLLEKAGYKVIDVKPRYAADEGLPRALDLESKVQYHRGEIGYMVTAQKYGGPQISQ